MKAETGGLQNFEKILYRIGGLVGFKQKKHAPLLPIYESFGVGAREIGEFLPAEELIEQTHRFMLGFQQMAESGKLPDTVFFLDKSARPVAYLFRKLYSDYCPGKKVPKVKFINIGRGGVGFYSNERPFTGEPSVLRDVYGRHIDQVGRILIVDDHRHTGETIDMTMSLFTEAFPQAQLKSMVVYSKSPNWFQFVPYLGVKEQTVNDYKKLALSAFNKENDTLYENHTQIPAEKVNRFWSLYQKIEGTVPFAKRGTTNALPDARRELDIVCEEIYRRKFTSHKKAA